MLVEGGCKDTTITKRKEEKSVHPAAGFTGCGKCVVALLFVDFSV
jgi:hypothetical protein